MGVAKLQTEIIAVDNMSARYSNSEQLENAQTAPSPSTQNVKTNSQTARRRALATSSYKSMTQMAEDGKYLKPLKKVWGNYILENSLTWFPSEAGTGKTFLMLELCMVLQKKSIEQFCGEPLELHGNSLYINCELGEDLLTRRVHHLYKNHPPNQPLTNLDCEAMVYTTRKPVFDPVEGKAIRERIEELSPVLVVIDNWKTAFRDSDKDKASQVDKVMTQLLEMKDSFKFSLVVVDHTKKGSRGRKTDSDLQSGSGSKIDLADADFFLRRSSQHKNYRILKRMKSRNCEDQDNPSLLGFNPETHWFTLLQKEVNEMDHLSQDVISGTSLKEEAALIKKLHEQGKSIRAIEEQLGISKSTVHNRLKQAENAPF